MLHVISAACGGVRFGRAKHLLLRRRHNQRDKRQLRASWHRHLPWQRYRRQRGVHPPTHADICRRQVSIGIYTVCHKNVPVLFLDPETGPQALPTLLLFFLGLLLSDFQSAKDFSFHNRSSLNFAYSLKTIFSTIAPCRIFKLNPN